jgi:hypothetical protein
LIINCLLKACSNPAERAITRSLCSSKEHLFV